MQEAHKQRSLTEGTQRLFGVYQRLKRTFHNIRMALCSYFNDIATVNISISGFTIIKYHQRLNFRVFFLLSCHVPFSRACSNQPRLQGDIVIPGSLVRGISRWLPTQQQPRYFFSYVIF